MKHDISIRFIHPHPYPDDPTKKQKVRVIINEDTEISLPFGIRYESWMGSDSSGFTIHRCPIWKLTAFMLMISLITTVMFCGYLIYSIYRMGRYLFQKVRRYKNRNKPPSLVDSGRLDVD